MRPPRVWPSGPKVQVLADRVVGEGSVADGGRHPLHRLSPSVAGREDSRHARLQRQRGPVEAPRRGRTSGWHFAAGEVPVGDDESPVVAPDLRGYQSVWGLAPMRTKRATPSRHSGTWGQGEGSESPAVFRALGAAGRHFDM